MAAAGRPADATSRPVAGLGAYIRLISALFWREEELLERENVSFKIEMEEKTQKYKETLLKPNQNLYILINPFIHTYSKGPFESLKKKKRRSQEFSSLHSI